MGPKMDQMSCYMNFHDRKCCEDHFEYSQISVGPVEPEILRKNGRQFCKVNVLRWI